MQKIAVLFCLFVCYFKGFSQQEYFLYLQTEDRKPFYARVATQMYSSSENGYIIIPKLKENGLELTIGFPRNVYPEQKFAVKFDKKSKGYLIKNLADKGWVLANLQNSEILLSILQEAKPVSEFTGNKKTDQFSAMLANVVNDSAILYNAVRPKSVPPAQSEKPASEVAIQKDQPKETLDTAAGAPVMDIIADTRSPEKKDTLSAPPLVNAPTRNDSSLSIAVTTPEPARSDKNSLQPRDSASTKMAVEKAFLSKLDEKQTTDMYEATYLELYNLTTDTVRIFIPLNDSPGVAITTVPAVNKYPDSVSASSAGTSVVADSARGKDTTTAKSSVPEILNSDCKNFATEHDVDKLRIRMLDDKTIDDKIASARKFFRAKCYTVSQIKALTELFPTDETRYRFFDTSYAYVSDTGRFFLLEEFFSNDFYKKKFQALIHK